MPLSKTITSTPSSGMFNTQEETYNIIETDVSSDYKLVTTTTPRGSKAEYVLASEAPESDYTITVSAGKVSEGTEVHQITVESLAPNTLVEVRKQRLEDGVVVAEHKAFK